MEDQTGSGARSRTLRRPPRENIPVMVVALVGAAVAMPAFAVGNEVLGGMALGTMVLAQWLLLFRRAFALAELERAVFLEGAALAFAAVFLTATVHFFLGDELGLAAAHPATIWLAMLGALVLGTAVAWARRR